MKVLLIAAIATYTLIEGFYLFIYFYIFTIVQIIYACFHYLIWHKRKITEQKRSKEHKCERARQFVTPTGSNQF